MVRLAGHSPTDEIAIGHLLFAHFAQDGYFRRAALWVALFSLWLIGPLALSAHIGDALAQMRRDTLTLVTSNGRHVIKIEVAETNEEKALGLMFRTSLADDAGMLFPYTPPQETGMWMRNTYIPLDMIFIREDGTVHLIETNTEPLSERVIRSRGPISAVLELAAGNAGRLGLKVGDSVLHSHFKNAGK